MGELEPGGIRRVRFHSAGPVGFLQPAESGETRQLSSPTRDGQPTAATPPARPVKDRTSGGGGSTRGGGRWNRNQTRDHGKDHLVTQGE